MIGIESKGDFKKTRDFLTKMLGQDIFSDLDRYGQMGVDALATATPIDTGLAAHSWIYRLTEDSHGPRISWHNTDIENDIPVVILIQYDHGTGTGGFVQGRDFINPAIQPIFDYIVDDLQRKVKMSQ